MPNRWITILQGGTQHPLRAYGLSSFDNAAQPGDELQLGSSFARLGWGGRPYDRMAHHWASAASTPVFQISLKSGGDIALTNLGSRYP